MKKIFTLLLFSIPFFSISQVMNITWTDTFTNGVSTTPAQLNDWNTFRSQLVAPSGFCYTKMTISGTFDTLGQVCDDQAIVTAYANALNTLTSYTSPLTNGNVWSLCASRYSGEVWLNPPSECDGNNCPGPNGYIIRPGIQNSNFGGVNSNTCNPPNQNMSFEFETVSDGAPTMICPQDTTVSNDLNSCTADVTYDDPKVYSCTSETTTLTAGLASGSTFPLGTTTNTFSSTNNAGTTTCSFTITVVDTLKPAPDNNNLSDVVEDCEVTSLTAPTATDLCDGSITGVSDAVFPIDNDTVVVWTYTDAEGNAVTQNQNVVITGVDVGVSLSGTTITADNGNADSYQWINCADSSTVTDATGQSFTPSANGDYAVIVTEGNCSDTSACETVSTVGIEDFGNGQSIFIYPNPNTGQFSVNFEKEVTQAEIIVYDLQGRVVESYVTKNTSTYIINLKEHTGTYTIAVTTEKGTQNFRVVVQ